MNNCWRPKQFGQKLNQNSVLEKTLHAATTPKLFGRNILRNFICVFAFFYCSLYFKNQEQLSEIFTI